MVKSEIELNPAENLNKLPTIVEVNESQYNKSSSSKVQVLRSGSVVLPDEEIKKQKDETNDSPKRFQTFGIVDEENENANL